MTDGQAKHNLECRSDSHSRHLCYLVSQGLHLTEKAEYESLAENPKFKCQHCGRTAKSEDSLCEPLPIE